jgi:hypothetical protein
MDEKTDDFRIFIIKKCTGLACPNWKLYQDPNYAGEVITICKEGGFVLKNINGVIPDNCPRPRIK